MKLYFIHEILSQTVIRNRVSILNKLMDCAFFSLSEYANYDLIEIIKLVLEFPPISSLTQTFALLDHIYGPKVSDFHQYVGTNCGNLKTLKEKSNIYPVIPPVKLYCSNLRKEYKLIEDEISNLNGHENEIGNRNSNDEKIIKKYYLNMSRLRKQDSLLRELQLAQKSKYQIRWNQQIHKEIFANNIEYITDQTILFNRKTALERI